jgi:ferric-dicitrate binding protein FerR (iron transport regulator)
MQDQTTNDKNIDDVINAIKTDSPSANEIAAVRERVKSALAAKNTAGSAQKSASSGDSWDSMEDYIASIPAYLAKQLSPQQTLLFEEESRRSIPLRRALNNARQGGVDQSQTLSAEGSGSRYRWLAAVAAVAMIAVALFNVLPDLPSFDQSQLAQITLIEGQLYQLTNGQLEPLSAGTWIDGRQRIRSATGSTAVLTLDDGSQIEVDGRSELSVTRRGSGNRIDVNRGRILVVASPQGSGTLDVFTDEFMVSVTGTIFEVAHGAKGSIVAVIEGEVNVHQQGDTTSLTPGEVMASRLESLALNIEDEINWSQDADLYIAMLQEVAALRQDLEAVLEIPPRFSTRLLDLAPQDTAVYIAVPNAPEKAADIYDVVRTRAQQSEVLAQAWASFEEAGEGHYIDETMAWVREIGYALGDETVVALIMRSADDGDGDVAVPVVLSEVNAEAFSAAFDEQIARLREVLEAQGQDSDLDIALINDPSDAADGQLSILLYEDLLIASIDASALQEMQDAIDSGGSAFVGTALHGQLQASYELGTEILGAVHIPKLMSPIEVPENGLEDAGLANAEFLIARYQQQDSVTTLTADLYFDGNRDGAMSFIANPGPMGSLEFFSANTTIVAALLLTEPMSFLDDIDTIVLPDDFDATAELELFYNVMSVLGGEFAIGLDGPALPTPSWKAVVEAYDATMLQQSINFSVERFNEYSTANNAGASISLSSGDVDGYTGYQLNLTVDPSQSTAGLNSVSIHYVFVDGYLVAAPNEALVGRAIDYYHSGSGLQSDSDFRDLLARDGYLDFSAIYFSRLGELLNDVLSSLPSNLTAEQQAAVAALDTEVGPSMASILALPDKIHVAYSGSSQFPLQMMSQLVALQPLIESMTEQVQ